MRSHTLAALVATLALASGAHAQNTIELAHPLVKWMRTPSPAGGDLPVTFLYDDGASENAVGIQCGQAVCPAPGTSTLVWAHYFDTNDPLFSNTSSDTITRIDVAIGTTAGGGPPAGGAINVYVFDDPNDDGSPIDLTGAHLVTQGAGTNTNPDADFFETIAVPPGSVQGGFFIIATMVHMMATSPPTPGIGEFPGALDNTLPNPPAPPRVWVNCTNFTWSPTNPQASSCGGWADMQNLPILGVWLLRAEGTGTGPTNFCTAKTGLVCGTPGISATGAPSVSASSGFAVQAAPARQNKSGILLVNTSLGATPVPYEGGTLCVNPTGLRRAGSTNSGAGCAPQSCSGVYSIDMNTWGFAPGAGNNIWVVPDCNGAASGIAPNNAPGYMQTPGTLIYCQYWGRDSVATGSFVSDGLAYTIGT